MPAPKIYDVALDDFRPVNAKDVKAFGIMNRVLGEISTALKQGQKELEALGPCRMVEDEDGASDSG